MLQDRLSERKPVSFAELGPCFLFGSRRRNSFVKRCTSLFNSKGGSVPGVSTNTVLRYSHGSQAALFTGPPILSYCLFLGIWYFQIKSHTSNMGWNQNVRFETVAEITILWDVTPCYLLGTLEPTRHRNPTPLSFGFITEFIP